MYKKIDIDEKNNIIVKRFFLPKYFFLPKPENSSDHSQN